MARKLVQKYKLTTPPIDIATIIAAEGISIEHVNYPGKTSGESWREHGKGKMRINTNHSIRRRRFTMAHELGHLVLRHVDQGHQFRNFTLPQSTRHDRTDECEQDDSDRTGSGEDQDEREALYSNDPNEVEANQFAAELLMPWTMFKKDLLADMKIPSLAGRYNVSEEAAGWRAYTILKGR